MPVDFHYRPMRSVIRLECKPEGDDRARHAGCGRLSEGVILIVSEYDFADQAAQGSSGQYISQVVIARINLAVYG